jgi:catechol 2,3-dioxygenase-like lactoylglutathione lyase family enzyme
VAEPTVADAATVHSLLHCNLNSADLAKASRFYEDVLGQRIGMRTTSEPTDGAALGVAGKTRTMVWFYYDERGPRTAPAIELMDWLSPRAIGTAPREPNRAGLAAIGYRVPSLPKLRAQLSASSYDELTESAAWPIGNSGRPAMRVRDADGVPVELYEADVEAVQFSHIRINVASVEASIEWYGRLGFELRARQHDAILGPQVAGLLEPASVSTASVSPAADPSVSFELTEWRSPTVTGTPISPAYHVGLYRIALGVDDVEAARAELVSLGGAWRDLPEPLWVPLPGTKLGGLTVLFLTDPDGVVVELVGRPRRAMTGRN